MEENEKHCEMENWNGGFFSILSLAKSELELSSIDDEIEVSDSTQLDVYFLFQSLLGLHHRNLELQTLVSQAKWIVSYSLIVLKYKSFS